LSGDCPILPAIDAQGETIYAMFGAPNATMEFVNSGIPDRWELALLARSLCDPDAQYHCEAVAAFNFNKVLALDASFPQFADFVAALASTSSSAGTTGIVNFLGVFGAQVVTIPGKAADEPFSATGDLDGDGATNLEEHGSIDSLGLGRVEYVAAASTPGPFWEGNPDLPAAGVAGLVLLAGACVLIGKRAMGKK